MSYEDLPEDYTQVCKIIEYGFKGDKDKMVRYFEMYLQRYPNGAYAKLLKSLKEGNNNPDNIHLFLHDM